MSNLSFSLCNCREGFLVHTTDGANPIFRQVFKRVITSYSIHYTKLYDTVLPVDADGDGLDDNTGLPYVPLPVDADGDGIDDNTGEPYVPITTATIAPTGPTPTPAGGGDDFQG